MKVQINRLLADGQCSSISYITGSCRWDFQHTAAQHCDSKTLHVHNTRLTAHHGHPCRDPAHYEETICTIQGYKTVPAVDSTSYSVPAASAVQGCCAYVCGTSSGMLAAIMVV